MNTANFSMPVDLQESDTKTMLANKFLYYIHVHKERPVFLVFFKMINYEDFKKVGDQAGAKCRSVF